METLLLVEADERFRAFWEPTLQREGFETVTVSSFEEALGAAQRDPPALVFLGSGFDGKAGVLLLERLKALQPDLLVLMPSNLEQLKARIEIEAVGERHSAGPGTITIDQVTVAVKDALELQKLRAQQRRATQAQTQQFAFEQIIGNSSAIQELKQTLAKAIEADPATILLGGETGTGKELAAKAIHYNSPRKDKPFVVFECTAVPPTLMETELFGHEAGAFTDARVAKKGLLETADGGTIFLDEIGDLEPQLQGKLLRVLEEKRFRRVGSTKELSVDVRFVAATNKDLSHLVEEGRFREDLYYRLSVFPVYLPPLRQHKEDLPELTQHFIDQFNREFHRRIAVLSPEAQQTLAAYEWPGNVRELKNVIERTVILEQGEHLSAESLRLTVPSPTRHQDTDLPVEGLSLKEQEHRLVQQALERAQGNQTEAARLLGVSRFALRSRLKRLSAEQRVAHDTQPP